MKMLWNAIGWYEGQEDMWVWLSQWLTPQFKINLTVDVSHQAINEYIIEYLHMCVLNFQPYRWLTISFNRNYCQFQMNQQCKVCGEPAAGFHFGAFTCEGCKVSQSIILSFIRRIFTAMPSWKLNIISIFGSANSFSN